MALPPLVVTGAIISAAHINSIRNHLGTWSTTVSAGGNDLTNVGTITANVGAFGGSITSPAISTANIGVSGVMSATSAAISGTATVGSLASSGVLSGSDVTVTGIATANTTLTQIFRLTGAPFKYLECESAHLAFYKAAGDYPYFWRRSANGHADGAGSFDLMTLDDNGNLGVTNNVYARIFVQTGQTLGSPVGSQVLAYQTGITDVDSIYLEQIHRRLYAGTGQQVIESKLRRKVGAALHGYVGFGSQASNVPYVSVGEGDATEWVRFNAGTVIVRAQNGPAGEGGEIQIADPTGANLWALENYQQHLRLGRSGASTLNMVVSSTGRITLGSVAPGSTSYCRVTISDTIMGYNSAASGMGTFKIGGSQQTEQGIIFGNQFGGGTDIYGWMQAITPGTANYPMVINPLGGGVALSAPTSAVPDAILANNTFSFYVDEVTHRLYVRVKESNGTMRTGYIQV
jgi:hypothetical protein